MSDNLITELNRHLRNVRDQGLRRIRRRRVLPPPLPPSGKKTWKYLKPAELEGFKNLLFAARTIVEGYYAGRHRSPYKGSAPEFVDYREYYPGDELRTIDWKAFARTDRYIVKLFEKETDMNCYLLLDTSASMGYSGETTRGRATQDGMSKLEYGCFLCAALTYLMVKQGDKVGMTAFDEDIHSHVPPGGTFSHLYKVMNTLERCVPGNQTSLSYALRKAFGLYERKGLLIIVSDMLDEPEDVFRALSMYTHRGFEILLFHVFHPLEYRLPALANANFIDSETGEFLTCLPADIEQAYNTRVEEFIGTCRSLARARGIDYNFINTDTPYGTVLEKYLLKRRSF